MKFIVMTADVPSINDEQTILVSEERFNEAGDAAAFFTSDAENIEIREVNILGIGTADGRIALEMRTMVSE